ncbi:MAG: glutathione S-transferase C-terminal domain-containing protein [Rhizobiaceae bacterium]|nr:glutathione S-transferase C-terminal domain-containing protein [Rhizobiaceae bacterium]
MGYLHEGTWLGGDERQIGASGWEPRQERIRGWITADAQAGTSPAVPGRYHLIDCPGCPMSHRVSIVHRMKRLHGVVSTARVRPVMGPNGREFGTADHAAPDRVTGYAYLYELYLATDPAYSGRASTPVLWDTHERRIVSNSYSDIFAMMNSAFDAFTDVDIDFRPPELEAELKAELAWLGEGITGAVYRGGFARDQAVYEENAARLARTFPLLEQKLRDQPYLLGPKITEADLTLLATLLRFDAIYVPLFKCTGKRVSDHPNLCAYVGRLMALPGVAETFDLGQSMRHYFVSHAHLNPTRIVPVAPPSPWAVGVAHPTA